MGRDSVVEHPARHRDRVPERAFEGARPALAVGSSRYQSRIHTNPRGPALGPLREGDGFDRSVDVLVSRLRRKLEKIDPEWLQALERR